jgi:HK97 family phage portal protein
MGALATQLTRWLAGERRFTLRHPPQWFVDWLGGGPSAAGVTVNHKAALRYTPFWSAVRIISGTLGALPFLVYRRLDNGGKDRVPEHPVYALLHDTPNEYMDAVTFQETRQAHVLTYGNGYAEIQRDGAGHPVALWPLLPNRTSRKMTEGGTPYYEVQLPTGEPVHLPDRNVLHIKGLGFDGYTGYDVVSYHKEALGYGIAVKEYGARFFANDGNPGGVFEHPNALSDTAFARLKESLRSNAGLKHAHRVQILEEGMKWSSIGVEPAKAQALEVQKFTVDDCSRIFNIPPHMLGSMEFSKYNNVEQLAIDFVSRTMLYWFRKWEQEVGRKLFSPRERGVLFCEILADGLLRGNIEARTAYYAAGRQWGFLSINDIRAKENMNPIGPAGDIYLDPLNMVPAGTLPAQQPVKRATAVRNAVEEAHRALIAGQWTRIIDKQLKTQAGGADFSYERLRVWALKLLSEPVNAYASVRGIGRVQAEAVLDGIISESINKDHALEPAHAEMLADRILEKIGGNHHAIRE